MVKPAVANRCLYRPIKGDLVDELIAKYINQMQVPLPVRRMGDGNYIFGTKKIFAKIMNGKLVIRVGGGFMSIEEFLNCYSEIETQKVNQMLEKGTFNIDDYVNFEDIKHLMESNNSSPDSKFWMNKLN